MSDAEGLKQEFLAEAQEHLDTIGKTLHGFETYAKKGLFKADLVNQLFRSFHSLKGLSGMLGYTRISRFTHALEDLLDKVRLGKVPVTEQLSDALYNSLDVLIRLLHETADDVETIDVDAKVNEIQGFLQGTPATASAQDPLDTIDLDEQTRKSLTEYEEHRLRESIRSKVAVFSISLLLDVSNFDQVLRDINKILNNHGELISTLPAYDQSLDTTKMRFRLLYASSEPMEVIRAYLPPEAEGIEYLYQGGESTVPTSPVTPPPIAEKVPETPPLRADETAPSEEDTGLLRDLSNYVRVDLRYLDELMNVIGEMFILQNQQSLLLQHGIRQNDKEIQKIFNSAYRYNEDIGHKLGEAQRHVLEMRLVPIGTIYGRLERLVRRLSRQFDKNVQSVLLGGETKLDKVVMENLVDPMVHLIRNAIDHGIEAPRERIAKGKPEIGTIRISSFHLGNNIVIRVEDDGRGVPLEKVRKQAIKLGLLEDREELTAQEILRVLFLPGFSLAETVTEVSGRGVGLDVVKKIINQLNGTITVLSEPGQGTTFEIVLPITLAIISAVIIRVGTEQFALPLSGIVQIAELQKGSVTYIEGREILRYQHGSIPLIRLHELFNLESSPLGYGYAVIGKIGRQQFSIFVDEIIRMQEIVVKRIARKIQFIRGISGAAEIGEEQPILVIDPAGLVEQTYIQKGSLKPVQV